VGIVKTKVLVLGGGLSGLVASHTLSCQGIEHILIEKSPRLGGGNRSYQDSKGRHFDCGYHALDWNRSKCATEFFTKALKGQYHCFHLQRGIAMGGEVFDYALAPGKWPTSFQKRLASVAPIDDIEAPVTRDKLNAVYGEMFTTFIFDTVLSSYPTLMCALDDGGDLADQLRLIYPWFFPAVSKNKTRIGESECYHDAMRENGGQKVLYPKEAGFEWFLTCLSQEVERGKGRILVGESGVDLIFKKGTFEVEKVTTSEGDLIAEDYLWCAPVPQLIGMVGGTLELGSPQHLVLGNFSFKNELISKYHEILVGDKNHLINRISYPEKMAQSKNTTLQVEFLCPAEERYEMSAERWRSLWEDSLKEFGLIKESDIIEEYSFHRERRGFVVAEKYEDLVERCRNIYTRSGTDIKVPFFSLGPENINRLIPSVTSYIKREML